MMSRHEIMLRCIEATLSQAGVRPSERTISDARDYYNCVMEVRKQDIEEEEAAMERVISSRTTQGAKATGPS